MVTLTLPDGTALAFKPRLEVHPNVRIYSPEPDCSVVPQNQVSRSDWQERRQTVPGHSPEGVRRLWGSLRINTLGTLEPIDPPEAIAYPRVAGSHINHHG